MFFVRFHLCLVQCAPYLYGLFLASPCSRGWLLRRDPLHCLVERNGGDGVMVFAVMKMWFYMLFGWFYGGEGVVVVVVVKCGV